LAGTKIYYVTDPTTGESRIVPRGDSGAITPKEAVTMAVTGVKTEEQWMPMTREEEEATRKQIEESKVRSLTVPEFETPERLAGEPASEYHARVMREEIAWERELPMGVTSAQLGGMYREWGMPEERPEIVGYEPYKVKPAPMISPRISRIKGVITRTFFPEVREVREMEALGIPVPFEKKYRAEMQKFFPAMAVGAGAGYVVGAGVGLLPAGAITTKAGLALAIPAGYGIVKGIRAREYGLVAGGVVGGAWGFPRGFRLGREVIKPTIKARITPVRIEAVTEAMVRPLPARRYEAGVRGIYRAKIGKKTYTGVTGARIGLEPHPYLGKVTGRQILTYKGKAYATIAKWNVAKLKAFAKKTGLKVSEIKARVQRGELVRTKFVKYTKPVETKYVGITVAKPTEYISAYVAKRPTGLRAGLAYGRKYLEIGKAKFYKAIGREYRPTIKIPRFPKPAYPPARPKPTAEMLMYQKVTVQPRKLPPPDIAKDFVQIQKVVAPKVQRVLPKPIFKVITKAVRAEYAKAIAKQFKPRRGLIPIIIPKVKVARPAVITKERIKAITAVKPALIQIAKPKAIPMVRAGVAPRVAVKARVGLIPVVAPAVAVKPAMKMRMALVLLAPAITPTPPTPFVTGVPPTPLIPFFAIPRLDITGGIGRVPVRARYGYTPSYSAFVFKIYGRKTPPRFGERYTGFQLRKIPRKFRWAKVFAITRRRRK